MKKTRNFAALIGVLVLFLFIFQVDTRESAAADIVSVQPHFAEGPDGIVMAVEMAFPQGYHAYAHESGDAGRPTTLSIRLDDGSGLPVWYPQGFMQRDLFDPDATVYVYESPTTLFVLLPHEARHRGFEAVLSMLLCSSRNCLPVSQNISGQVRGWSGRPECRYGSGAGPAGRPAGGRRRKAPAAPGRFCPGADAAVC